MHIQFDALCLITEPSAESVGVAHEYLSMARDHSIEDRVMVVANQMESPDDEAYLHTQGLSPVASVPFIRDMRCVVREQGMLDLDSLSELASAANRLVGTIMKNIIPMTTEERYRRLSELHRIQAEKKHHPATRDELL